MHIEFQLTASCRLRLLQAFPPALPNVVCNHVTLYHGPDSRRKLHLFGPAFETGWAVVGQAQSEHVVALVVAHHGSTMRANFDRKTYHCTHSLADGHYARESNDLLEKHGWQSVPWPIPLQGRIVPVG